MLKLKFSIASLPFAPDGISSLKFVAPKNNDTKGSKIVPYGLNVSITNIPLISPDQVELQHEIQH
jgi:hypothetical protein